MDEKQNVFGNISAYFINKYRAVYLILLVVFILGYSDYSGLPREEMPETDIPFGMINTRYSGVAPEDASDPVVRTANTVDRPIMEMTISGDYDF